MELIAEYRFHYGPVPEDETWFGFLALLDRVAPHKADRTLELVKGFRLGAGPLFNEQNQGPAAMEVGMLEDIVSGR